MDWLLRETMARTGASIPHVDLPSIVSVTANHPDAFRLVGLFRNGDDAPESLMAFRWCGCSGVYADDLLAASTRWSDEEGQVPMMHAIMLDVFEWATALGARSFDFGGVVLPDVSASAGALSITKFKQQFGGEIAHVGVDLRFDAAPVRSALGRTISTAMKWRKR
jgi:hypothetical protein